MKSLSWNCVPIALFIYDNAKLHFQVTFAFKFLVCFLKFAIQFRCQSFQGDGKTSANSQSFGCSEINLRLNETRTSFVIIIKIADITEIMAFYHAINQHIDLVQQQEKIAWNSFIIQGMSCPPTFSFFSSFFFHKNAFHDVIWTRFTRMLQDDLPFHGFTACFR